ncbi:MAG: glucarate dehydratase [Betaproteobacteria bacterium]|nr:glucarate dehydratase [Betaproteobacteria bacterium]
MKIKQAIVTPIAFRDPPLLNAAGIHEPYALRSIIEIETDNWHIGLGESYGDAPVLELLQRVAGLLPGMSPFDFNGLRQRSAASVAPGTRAERLEHALAPGTDPRKDVAKLFSAFEVAFLDLQARSLGIPLVELLGGAVRREVPYSAYLFYKYAEHVGRPYAPDRWGEVIDEVQLVNEAKSMIDQYGFDSIKLKAGVFPAQQEAACMKALKRAFPDKPLRIDPNSNWSVQTSVEIGKSLEGVLEYYEDPTPALEGMAEVHRATGMALATNMVVTDFAQFEKNVHLNAAQIILSDHHYWGGLRETQVLARMCETFGLGLSMHSNSHLGISLLAMTHLAASVPRLSYACDTHYPWQEEEILVGGKIPIRNGCVAITDAPGLGVEIDQSALASLHDQYLRCGIRNRNDTIQMRKYHPGWDDRQPRF